MFFCESTLIPFILYICFTNESLTIDASLTGFTILMVICLHVQHKNLWETQYNKLIYLQKMAKVQSDMNGHFLLNETKVVLYLNWGFL